MVDDGVKLAKRTVIQALTREKGEATADRLLYAYRLLAERFKDVGELLEFIREHLLDEVDVEEHEYYPFRGGSEKWYKLRLRDARSDESMKALSPKRMARVEVSDLVNWVEYLARLRFHVNGFYEDQHPKQYFYDTSQ